jgi:hypothetical protein
MPLLVKPYLTRIQARTGATSERVGTGKDAPMIVHGGKHNKYVASFSYDFSGDVPTQQIVQGISFQGSMVELNMQSVAANAEVRAIKALQITCEFYSGAADVAGEINTDSDLFVFIPATGQLIRLAPSTFPIAGGTIISSTAVLAAVVPVASFSPTVIQFVKGVASFGGMFGKLTVSAFDFSLPPYSTTGFSTL